MSIGKPFVVEDLPHSSQLRRGFPWLIFEPGLETEYRRAILDETVHLIRVNLGLAALLALAFWWVEPAVLPPHDRGLALLHVLVVVPLLAGVFGASFTPHRNDFYAPLALAAGLVLGLSTVALVLATAHGGPSPLFPGLLLTTVFVYFMGGLIFHLSLGVNVLTAAVFLVIASLRQPSGGEFGYEALAIVAANVFCAAVGYMHERTSRLRFLEAGLLRELVARDGLTGIQNRRMFDQHMPRIWLQGLREAKRVAVLLIDIDCFKDYNDRYGHQAGDECLRAVALALSDCARRPLDFVARYGGEEFAVVLFEANREHVGEVLARIQKSIADLQIPHAASRVASRLTVSIGAACVMPSAHRTPDGLVQLADEALYSAKEQGRNRVVLLETEYQSLRTGRFEKRSGQVAV